MEWVFNKLSNGLNWLLSKLGIGINGIENIFMLIAIIGVYLVMSGNRNLGTKFTSLSILTYIIFKAVF